MNDEQYDALNKVISRVFSAVEETNSRMVNGVAIKMPGDTFIEDEQQAWHELELALKRNSSQLGLNQADKQS